MHAGREAVTARVVTLMTPAEKTNLELTARDAGLSVGELVRRSVVAYDPTELEQLEQIADLAHKFRERVESASAAVDRANANTEKTLEYFRRKREG